jgi:GntR family transcriptional repressor for pyruvate dehydrogenase complex
MIQPVKQQRLYEKVADQFQDLIASGNLSAGDRLPNERMLAEQFAVSRTVVREALKTLAVRGLIEVRPGQGTFVVDATGDTLSRSFQTMLNLDQGDDPYASLVEVREILEPEIAYRAALRATPENVAAMRAAVSAMDAHMDDMTGFIRADDAFHLALAVATHNAYVPRLLSSVVDVLHEHRSRIFRTAGGAQRGQGHHKRILRAVEDGAPEAAREAMRGHLAQVRDDTRHSLSDGGAGSAPTTPAARRRPDVESPSE